MSFQVSKDKVSHIGSSFHRAASNMRHQDNIFKPQ